MQRLVRATLAFGLVLSAACSKKDDAASLAPAASALAVSQAPSGSMAWHYVVDPKSTTHVDMPGIKEHIKADTTAAAGSLDVAPAGPHAVARADPHRPHDASPRTLSGATTTRPRQSTRSRGSK